MFAKLSALVSSAPAFPYVITGQHEVAWGSWVHLDGTVKDAGVAVSIFKISAASSADPKLHAARNGVRRLKLVRHPNILAFRDMHEVEEKGQTVIYLVTEPVLPLVQVLSELDMSTAAKSEYTAMGFYHIAHAVSFLNNDCGLVHGNVCMRAVVVTPTLDWRLHGFDLLSEHTAAGDSESGNWALTAASWMVSSQYKPAEVGRSDWQAVKEGPPWAVDAWGVGCLMQEAFSGRQLTQTEDLRNTEQIPKAILQDYQRLLASAPARRLNPAQLAQSSVLKNKLVDIIAFLENLAVKDGQEKDLFFKRLPAAIPSLPLPLARRKLLPMLANALEFGGAPAVALSALLQIGQTLDADGFRDQVVPVLSKLFTSTDRGVRRSLLESIDVYGPHLTQGAIEEQIYPQVSTGFLDSNAYLRELTLKSMLVLAPKLTQRTLNQSLLKSLAKLQVDKEPAIRANTTILLGNLASHLSEPACKRVLLNAFARALKDGFPPSRIAGLKAMVATAAVHSADEAAQRILPAVSPLAVDQIQEVRHAALACIQTFSQILSDHNRTLDDALNAAGPASRELQQGVAASTWTMGLGSNLGWALPLSLRSSPGAGPVKSASAPYLGNIESDGSAPPTAAALPALAPAEQQSTSGDGWNSPDEGDGWGDDAGEAAARQRLSRPATRPAAPQAPHTLAAASEDWHFKDDAFLTGNKSPEQGADEGLLSKPLSSARPRPAGRGARPRAAKAGGSGVMKLGAQKLTAQSGASLEL